MFPSYVERDFHWQPQEDKLLLQRSRQYIPHSRVFIAHGDFVEVTQRLLETALVAAHARELGWRDFLPLKLEGQDPVYIPSVMHSS